MWPFASGALSEQPIAAASYSTSSNRAPSVSAGFSLLLHVYPLSQVPQYRRLYHLASASLVAKVITDSGAASLHRRYPASLVLPTPPPPSRLSADFPVLPVIRPTFAPPISQRGEEGFSSCLARPRHRAVATTPPECRSASASLRCVILLSSSEGGLSLPGFDVSGPPLRSLALRPGDSPTTLTVTCRWASKSQFPFSLPSKLRGSGRVNGLQILGFPPPCHPNYRALALTPAGLSPAERASLCWTHKSLIKFSWLPRPCAIRNTCSLLRFELLTTIQ